MKFSLRFGLISEKLSIQLRQQGLHLANARRWERRARAISELRVLSILTDAEARKAEKRFMQRIQKDITLQAGSK
jgi:hypothetical protein